MNNKEPYITHSISLSPETLELNLKVSGATVPPASLSTPAPALPSIAEASSQSASPTAGFLDQLLHVEPKDFNLKFIFDNVRNYTLSAGVMLAGFALFKEHSPLYVATPPFADALLGIMLLLVGFGLYILNLSQIIWAMVKLKIRLVPYLVVGLLLFFGTGGFVWALLSKGGLFG